MIQLGKGILPFKRPPKVRSILVPTQTSEANMTLTLSEANSHVPATKEVSTTDAPLAPMKKVWSTITNRFWNYTEASSEGNTKSFEGLL
jgi:hypothetical protein